MAQALKLFGFFVASAFLISSCAYLLLRSVMPHGYVFAGLPRMFMYHETHPFQYIAIVALIYGVVATVCVIYRPKLTGWRLRIAAVSIMLVTIVAASVPGGVLWKIHDMQAGFFPTGAEFWKDLLWGASTGLQGGWFVIALSFPYNIIGLIAGYAVTLGGFRMAANSRAEFNSQS